jgi:hypothetical protein
LLKPRRDIGRVADRREMYRHVFAQWAKYHRPGVNSDPHWQVLSATIGPDRRREAPTEWRRLPAGRALHGPFK